MAFQNEWYSPCALPMFPAREKTSISLPKCRWQVAAKHACTLDPARSGSVNYAVQASAGTHQETHSHATRQGTLVHSRLSSLNHCGMILGLKELNWYARVDFDLFKKIKIKKRPAGECYVEPSLIILSWQEKAHISLSPPASGFSDTLAEN